MLKSETWGAVEWIDAPLVQPGTEQRDLALHLLHERRARDAFLGAQVLLGDGTRARQNLAEMRAPPRKRLRRQVVEQRVIATIADRGGEGRVVAKVALPEVVREGGQRGGGGGGRTGHDEPLPSASRLERRTRAAPAGEVAAGGAYG